MPFSSSKYCYSCSRFSNLVDLSFEYLSFSNERKTTILFPSPLTFLKWAMEVEGGKEYLSSHTTLGTRGEVQNAIVWSLSTRINKELAFVFSVGSDEAAFRVNITFAGKTSAD